MCPTIHNQTKVNNISVEASLHSECLESDAHKGRCRQVVANMLTPGEMSAEQVEETTLNSDHLTTTCCIVS